MLYGLSDQLARVSNILVCVHLGTRPYCRQKLATLGTKLHDRHIDQHRMRLRIVHQDKLPFGKLYNVCMGAGQMRGWFEQSLK